jgi:hypothetical protein
MNLTGILQIFDQLPNYGKLIEELDAGKRLEPQGLIPGAKEPLLAKLILSLSRPILFLTGRVDAVPEWQQALEAWLPDNCRPRRVPEPTPLPFERGPWSDMSRNLRLAVLANLMAGQHPLIPVDDSRPVLLSSARAILQKTLPRRKFVSVTRLLKVGQLLDLDKLAKDWLTADQHFRRELNSSVKKSNRLEASIPPLNVQEASAVSQLTISSFLLRGKFYPAMPFVLVNIWQRYRPLTLPVRPIGKTTFQRWRRVSRYRVLSIISR